ncbi:MAG TPA: hypothetical protein VGL38_04640 [bacterium]
MKKITWAALTLPLMILLVLGLGCSTDKRSTATVGGSYLLQIVMLTPTDTLRFLPGDSASAQGYVLVKDASTGLTVTGVKVNLSLVQPNVGVIEHLNDTTNTVGRVDFIFRTNRQVGQGYNIVHANIGSAEANYTIWIQPSSVLIGQPHISLSKSQVQVAPPQEDSVSVCVTLVDTSGIGIAGYSLQLRTSCGRMASLPPTDASGRACTMWYSNNQGEGWCVLSVQVANQSTKDSIFVHLLPPVLGTLTMASDKNVIHADMGITQAAIRATLKDQHSVARFGDTIFFAAPNLGSVNAYAVTDSHGVAHAYFTADDIPSSSPSDSAVVTASYYRWGLSDTVRIWVGEASSVGTVTLRSNKYEGVAGIDSALLTVQASYDDNSPVNGRYAHILADCNPYLSSDSFLINNGTTQAIPWKFCSVVSPNGAPVHMVATVGAARSDSISITVDAGPARYVHILAYSNPVGVGQSNPISVIVTDSLGNHVGNGQSVLFETNLGTMSPSLTQTINGMATSMFNSGTTAGPAIIKATIGAGLAVDSVLCTVNPGGAATIQLDVSNPSPQVQGTGGMEWTQLQARVHDAGGNPSPDGLWVYFQILDAPDVLCNINNAQNPRLDSAMTSGGIALATFNAGRTPGPVSIRASVYTDSIHLAQATVSNISIVSGPPRHILIQPNSVGVDAGASWDVSVQALVSDEFNNPVRDGVAVFFSVLPDTATILSDTVVTGNGAHHAGVAETILRYISAATNQLVDITARTAGTDSTEPVTATITYQLPIQAPAIQLGVEPSSVQFDAQYPNGLPCHIRCIATLQDGHGVLINGSVIRFGTTRGRLYPVDNNTGLPVSRRTTGYDPDYQVDDPYGFGSATLYLVDTAHWIFPDPLSTEITGDVTVEVVGFSAATDSRVINFRRGNGGRPQ